MPGARRIRLPWYRQDRFKIAMAVAVVGGVVTAVAQRLLG